MYEKIDQKSNKQLEKKEDIYESHQRKPLGTFPNPEKNFPEGMDYEGKIYGIKSEKGHRAKESLNPSKNYDEVEKEYDDKRDLYRFSHKSYNAGEQKHRSYIAPPYNRCQKYGKPTPHDNAGKLTAKSLKWIDQCCGKEATPVVQKRVDSFRERTQPQLGKPLDPIKDTMHVPDDHTFGVLLQPDEYGVGDLLHGRAPKHYLRGQEKERGLIAAIRSNLKKANYQNFNNLVQAFCLYDPDEKGYITATDLKNVCEQFQLPIELELLVQLFDYCDVDRDGRINYIEFSNFLNWKDKLPTGLPDRISSADHFHKRLQKQIDKAIVDQKTSSQMINSVVGGVSTKSFRSYGVPSIRNDLPAPKIKKCDDRTNYGDESDAFGLLQPSIFSRYGVYERDMLSHKSRDENTRIDTEREAEKLSC
ncbi:DgyrCDS11135 [Dimorphilus gyrociliatus]|uniref:DgyrCDS11135 n=1 Tax=Dimorphilus gyrociliatus TaxID=2664684 RepID=A0A7I8W3G6_9ANNE|nr:DgyrCDS11135 [Dimorphilus gyrociliatus]